MRESLLASAGYLTAYHCVLLAGLCAEKRKMICFTYAMHAWSMAEREKYLTVPTIGSLAHICWGRAKKKKKEKEILQKLK